MAQSVSKQGLFLYLNILTAFFLLLEISFFITCNKIYLEDFTHVAADLTIPFSVLPAIFFFILIEISLHFFYALSIWWVTLLICKLLYLKTDQGFLLGLVLWLIGIVTILLLNSYLFPNSKFSELISVLFFNRTIIKIFLYPLLAVSLTVIALAAIQLIIEYRYLCGVFSIAIFSIYTTLHYPHSTTQDASSGAKPNIIIIGVDALRPDFLSFFGHEKVMPFFDTFLPNATVFSDAVTPLARTFPSWTSLLTGQYPLRNGVRFNFFIAQHDMLN